MSDWSTAYSFSKNTKLANWTALSFSLKLAWSGTEMMVYQQICVRSLLFCGESLIFFLACSSSYLTCITCFYFCLWLAHSFSHCHIFPYETTSFWNSIIGFFHCSAFEVHYEGPGTLLVTNYWSTDIIIVSHSHNLTLWNELDKKTER